MKKYIKIMYTVWVVMLVGIILNFCGYKVFYINTTPSIPCGIYLNVGTNNIKEWDYVVYEQNDLSKQLSVEREYADADTLFMKHVGCLPGDKFVVNEITGQAFCNDKYIGQSQLDDTKGRPLPRLVGEYIIPDGEFLPIGDNTRSFDGRYTGTVPIKNIKARVISLITF